MANRFTMFILPGVVLGIVVGYALNSTTPPPQIAEIAGYFGIETVVGNSIATAVVAKWEGELGAPLTVQPAQVTA